MNFSGVDHRSIARLAPKINGKGAAWAVAHRIGKVVWLMLHEGVEYQERGPAVANPRTLQRKFRKLLREFHRAGIDPMSLLEQPVIAAV